MRQFLRFCLVGAVGFMVDAGTLHLLVWGLDFGLLTGRVMSYLTAATVTWVLHRAFTFRLTSRSVPDGRVTQWLRFLIANGLGAAVNYAAYAVCILTGNVFRSQPVLAVAVGSVFGLAFNYAASKRFVFRHA